MSDGEFGPVGVVGVGNMGGAIARAMLTAGLRVFVYDERRSTVDRLAAEGAGSVESLLELTEQTKFFAIVVVSDDQVRAVGDELVRCAARGSTLIVHSTVRPSTIVELAESARQRDIAVIDAAVSGGAEKAAHGALTLMIGGDHAAVLACAPIFDAIGDRRFHVGPVGSGVVMKLANNLLSLGGYALCLEAMQLAAAYGLDEDTVTTVVTASQGDSRQMRSWGRHDRARRSRRAEGVEWADRMGRDLVEAAIAAGRAGVLIPLTASAAEMLPYKLRERDQLLDERGAQPLIPRCPVCDYELAAPYRTAGVHPECQDR